MKYVILVFLSCSLVKASDLECKTLVNLDVVGQNKVTTQLSQKVLIDQLSEITSYVTETKPDFYSLEAFIPSLEMRIYSEAKLNKIDDTITLSAWARNIMLDVICKKLN